MNNITNNREIKFRVWDKTRNIFMNPDQCGFLMRYGLIHGNVKHPVYDLYYNPDVIIQQYTGLKDLKGKEIFEGDVVKYKVWHGRYDEEGKYNEYTAMVLYKDGAFYPRPIDDECEDSWYSYKVYDLEIIGNVMENPELDKNE